MARLFCCLLVAFVAAVHTQTCNASAAHPLAETFKATVTIIAHQVNKTLEYPPWKRVIDLTVDYPNRRARLDIKEGYEAGRVYIRRYDQKKEYMIKGGEYPECQRAYLGETFPPLQLPASAVAQGETLVKGVTCLQFEELQYGSRVIAWVNKAAGVPVALDEWAVDLETGEETQLISYHYSDVTTNVDKSVFDIPKPWVHKTCTRNIGGFPYLHLFHHYVRL